MVLRVDGAVRRYAWGDPDWIPRMLGREPDGGPVAELWFGTHPSAPCRIAGGRTLADLVRSDPRGTVGRRDATGLPFLVKVLAAAAPLSIQLHPDGRQAAEGFAREEAAGIPVDAPDRTYRDAQPKPELVCAVTPFTARCGLLDPEDAAALLAGLDVGGLAPLVDRLRGSGPAADRLAGAVDWLLELPAGRAGDLVDAVVGAASAQGAAGGPSVAWTPRLAAAHPGDVGVLVALLLHHVELQPGEALFLGAGQLHAYLEGTAVEVMAPSDNVVRGGLTAKHVDRAELRRLLDPRPTPPAVQRPAGPDHVYEVPGGAFGLRRIDLARSAPALVGGPAVLIATEGEVVAGAGWRLARGQAAFIAAAEDPAIIGGTGVVHLATGPRPDQRPAPA